MTLKSLAEVAGSAVGVGIIVTVALLWLMHCALKGGVDEPRHWWE